MPPLNTPTVAAATTIDTIVENTLSAARYSALAWVLTPWILPSLLNAS